LLVRVCRLVPGFANTVSAFAVVIPLLAQHVLILAGTLYFFAIVGMHAFAGKLVKAPAGTFPPGVGCLGLLAGAAAPPGPVNPPSVARGRRPVKRYFSHPGWHDPCRARTVPTRCRAFTF
jgi:hypothetical protein